MNKIKEVLGTDQVHLEPAQGSDDQCVAYCSKEDTRVAGPWTFGERMKPGRRNDLEGLVKGVLDGKTDFQIATEAPEAYALHAKHVQCLRSALLVPLRRERIITTSIIGPTGIGKTRWAFDTYPNIYRVNIPGKNEKLWWDGYAGEDVILFDDFYGEVPLTQMLHILDPYPLRVEVKGSTVAARWTKVIITSNDKADTWYCQYNHSAASIGALMRRLTTDGSTINNVDTRAELQMVPVIPPSPPPQAPTPQIQSPPSSPRHKLRRTDAMTIDLTKDGPSRAPSADIPPIQGRPFVPSAGPFKGTFHEGCYRCAICDFCDHINYSIPRDATVCPVCGNDPNWKNMAF